MLQTEFNDGSGSKLVICWDSSIDTNESAAETTRGCDHLVEKVNQLYETISAFSAEFVHCMRQIHCSKHDANIASDALNLSFKISDTATEHSSDEISRLRLEVDKLKRENHELEADLQCKIADISDLEKVHEQDKRQLRNKYQKDMSELRVYFEKICHNNYERDITSHLYNHKKNEFKVGSNSDSEAADRDYTGTNCIRFESIPRRNGKRYYATDSLKYFWEYFLRFSNTEEVDLTLDFDDVDYNSRNKSEETISSDLKVFIVKAYESQLQKFKHDFNSKKDEEMEKLKEDNVKYSEMIETLQNEVNRLVREKAVEKNVKEINREVRREYETELEELQDISDKEFLRKMNNDKVTLEKEFKRKFENALNELNDEWEKKIEVLCELLVRSTIKSVNLEETYSKTNEEKETLRLKLFECIKVLSLDENTTNIEEIVGELLKMKNIHQYESDKLQKENVLLRDKIEDLQQRIPPANSSREKVITMLIEEITDLIQKEQLGETVAWPTELAALENVFSRKLYSTQNHEPHEQNKCFPQCKNDETNEGLDNSLDMNQLLEERDGLRKVNVTLKGVINMFTRYLTNCEEECNNTLIEALINAEKHKKNPDDTIGPEGSTFDSDHTSAPTEDETKSVRFSSNISEFMNFLEENDHVNISSHDGSLSVTGNDLKSWLQIVRNEASHVLQLISSQKNDANCEKRCSRNESVQTASAKIINYRDEAAQTILSAQEIEKDEEKMVVLQHSLQKAENELRELQEKISFLEGFIESTELLEGYGEANHSIGYPNCVSNAIGMCQDEEVESDVTSEVYCAKCDDFQKQIRYVRNLLEQNKKHLERQALERDSERDEYDKQMKTITEERDLHLSMKERFRCEATLLEQQVKELSDKLEENMECKHNLETRIKAVEKQLRTLQEENIELKEAAAVRSEFTTQVEKKIKIKEEELKTLRTDYQKLLDELDSLDEIREKQVQEFSDAHVTNSNVCDKMKKELVEIERVVTSRTRMLENSAVVFVASSVLSSPSASISEDISCEQHPRLFSPNESDSSPGRNRISFHILACLHDKLNKLFRAEDASFRKIRDQEMQLAKIIDEVKNVELERDTLNQSLRITSDKLSQTKRELENWRVGQHSLPYQSTVQLELTAKIRKLQSEIKHYKEYLTQKDECDATYLRTVNSLQGIVSTLHFDKKDEVEEKLRRLYARFEQLEQEKRIQQRHFAVLEDDSYETDGTPKRKMRRLARSEAFTQADVKNDPRKSRVSFAENLESYSPDPDVTRRAPPAAVVSPLPGMTSSVVADNNSFSNNKVPRLNLNKSVSFLNAKSPNLRPNFDAEQIPIPEIKDLGSYDSISLDSNAAAFGSSIECNGEKSGPSEEQDSSSAANENDGPEKHYVRSLRGNVEQEKKRHQVVLSTLRRMKEANALGGGDELDGLIASCDEIEGESHCKQLNSSKDSLSNGEDDVRTLTKEMKTSIAMMRQLEQKLREVECKLEGEVELCRNECQESKNVCQVVIKERIDIEKRYEQLTKKIEEVQDQLRIEKSKSVELSAALETVREEVTRLQTALGQEKELVKTLTHNNENMKHELERARLAAAEEAAVSCLNAASGIEKHSESLKDLAEKVQKEVELAVELDEHLLKNLESTSASSTWLNNLFNVSSTLSPNTKRVLFKILQDGCENLMLEDKKILVESFNLLDATNVRQLEETNKELLVLVENEKLIVANLTNEQNFFRSEISRLETVLTFYEERITFLGSKIDDYRNRYVTNEIHLTAEKCTRTQLECQVVTLKKECNILRNQLENHVQKYENETNSLIRENVDLKHNLDTLRNQIEALTAEMNSIKAISQYHSNSEAELSRSLYPLKSRLEEVQKKYSRIKVDLEMAVNESQKLKFDLKVERIHGRQLEERQKSMLLAKHDLEEKLIEMKMKYDDLIWQKQKVDEKLTAFELIEARKHRIRMDGINLTREENESAQRQLEDEYDRLRRNILKVKDNFISLHYSWKKVCEKCQTIYHRMLRAEKNQRALVYQKNYFITRGYHESTLRPPPTRKFKSVVVALMSLRRMEFLTSRRLEHGRQTMLRSFADELPNVKVYPWFDFVVDLPEGIDGSDLMNESERNVKDVEFLLINDSLKALHAQFQTLLNRRD